MIGINIFRNTSGNSVHFVAPYCAYDSVYASNSDERSIIGTERRPCTLTRAYIHTYSTAWRAWCTIFPHERGRMREEGEKKTILILIHRSRDVRGVVERRALALSNQRARRAV